MAVRVTCTVPEPVIVPWAALLFITSAAAGVKTDEELRVKVPTMQRLPLLVTVAELLRVKL